MSDQEKCNYLCDASRRIGWSFSVVFWHQNVFNDVILCKELKSFHINNYHSSQEE